MNEAFRSFTDIIESVLVILVNYDGLYSVLLILSCTLLVIFVVLFLMYLKDIRDNQLAFNKTHKTVDTYIGGIPVETQGDVSNNKDADIVHSLLLVVFITFIWTFLVAFTPFGLIFTPFGMALFPIIGIIIYVGICWNLLANEIDGKSQAPKGNINFILYHILVAPVRLVSYILWLISFIIVAGLIGLFVVAVFVNWGVPIIAFFIFLFEAIFR